MFGTFLVVAVEFVLLQFVYSRAHPAQHAQVVAAASIARLESVRAADATAVNASVAALAHAAAGQVTTEELRAAGAAYRARPDAAGLVRTLVAARSVEHAVAARRASLDHEADWIYVALLLLASVGWMAWFRRLVSRHRSLERAVTETRSRAVGDQRLAALVRTSADAIMVCSVDGQIRYASPSVAAVLGADPQSLPGRSYTDFVVGDDRDTFRMGLDRLEPGAEGSLRLRMRHADDRVIDVEGTTTNLTADPAVEGYVVTVRDVTDRVRLEAALTRQAFRDSLTGLANRQLFSDRLQHALHARRDDEERSVVVLFCDLDDFKNVNDSLGHGVGDHVLVEIGERIRRSVRVGDTVARFGGDEFTILFEDLDVDDALPIASTLLRAFARPIVVDGRTIPLGASIGLASAIAGTVTSDEVLRNADVAMYLAKSRGKGKIAVYDSELHSAALRRLAMRGELAVAIDRGEVQAYFQPAVDVRTGRIVGFEALARWFRPDGSSVAPTDFVPLAEQSDLIHALGRHILDQACRAAVALNELSPAPVTMSVNVTAQQIARTDFVAEVLGIVERTGIAPELLTLEITESELVQDLPVVEERLNALRARSIRIAIDDFGTGFSSLSYLRNLPVDALKVDKSFIDGVTHNRHDAALTQAIIAMSSSVDLVTVAEGVENTDQARWLADTDVSHAQGFLWSQAVSADDARELISLTGGVIDPGAPGRGLRSVG
ncbi:putative bifunctional diguanylate cyclase/phosphodiesterase [uncultured Jatrophihabitans sp.]|uniref:putative bifunctional diguanylate cyclase/phosphodiesterase n=1 Tax=uncultured Jatrophihabitans sp. TaxID=1610747 RepID=UPI0035CAA2EA